MLKGKFVKNKNFKGIIIFGILFINISCFWWWISYVFFIMLFDRGIEFKFIYIYVLGFYICLDCICILWSNMYRGK